MSERKPQDRWDASGVNQASNVDRDRSSSAGRTDTNELHKEIPFSDSGSVTVAALLNLLRLMGAELVLNHGGSIRRFERAVRAQLAQFSSPVANAAIREAGLVHAKILVEHVLTQIRAQSELRESLRTAKSGKTLPASQSIPEKAMKLN